MRKPEAVRHTRRDCDGPVDSRGDEAVDAFGGCEPLDRRFVLGGDDRAPIRVPEAGRGGIAIDGDHVQIVPPCGGEQPELRRACA